MTKVKLTRSPPQWWSGRSTTAHLLYCVRSAFAHSRLWQWLYECSLHHFKTSQCMLKMCSIDTFNNIQLGGWNLKGGLFDQWARAAQHLEQMGKSYLFEINRQTEWRLWKRNRSRPRTERHNIFLLVTWQPKPMDGTVCFRRQSSWSHWNLGLVCGILWLWSMGRLGCRHQEDDGVWDGCYKMALQCPEFCSTRSHPHFESRINWTQ